MHHFARSLVPVGAKHFLPRTSKRVVVIGAGPSGLFCADRLRHHFEVSVVDNKEYFEFTPGILRAFLEPTHHSKITFDLRDVLENKLGVEFVPGTASGIEVLPAGQTASKGGSLAVAPLAKGGGAAAEACNARLHFDYCVVATGSSNGLWKPRALMREPPGGSASVSQGAPPTLETTLQGRRASLREQRELLASAKSVYVVGAGLVGVELAAELAHFLPRLKVKLVDGAPTVLPQLAEGARAYAHRFLVQHGVRLQLGTPFNPDSVDEDDVVLWCVGTKPRGAGLIADASVLKPSGQLRVNRRMQVLRRVSAIGSSLADAPNSPVELEPYGQGRVFAVGDVAAVEGVPMAQMIFHGEEMAAVAVANIEAAEDVASPFAIPSRGRREAEPGMPILCCLSLGPQDGLFATQSELVATGLFTAMQKQLIEDTKMGVYHGDTVSSLLWMPVH